MEFKVGDVVTLKSGGPKMTILQIQEFNIGKMAICQWFNGNDLEAKMFNTETLIKENNLD